MLLESLKACVLKSNVIYSELNGVVQDNRAIVKSRPGRHSIVFFTFGGVFISAGSVPLYNNTNLGLQLLQEEFTWDVYGDFLGRVDTFTFDSGSNCLLLETWYENIPTEQP